MEETHLKLSPTEKGDYLILLDDDQIISMNIYGFSENYMISKNHMIDKRDWKVYKMKGAKMLPEAVAVAVNIKAFKDCITESAVLEMAYRMQFLGKMVELEGKVYRVVSVSHHIHSWTIFNLMNQETKEYKQITVTERNKVGKKTLVIKN